MIMADLQTQADYEKSQEAQAPIAGMYDVLNDGGSTIGSGGDDAPQPGGGGTKGSAPSVEAQLGIDVKREMGEREKAIKDREGAYDQEISAIDKMANNMPQPPALGEAPKPPSQKELMNGAMEWMQLATALAAIAGGLGRGNTTAALNAFGGAIKGFVAGKKDVWETKIEEWKATDQKMREDNQAKIDQYKLIWQNQKMSMDMKLGAFKIAAQKYDDRVTYHTANIKDYETLAQFHQKEEALQQQMDMKSIAINSQLQRLKIAQDRFDQQNEEGAEIARRMASGDMPPNTPVSAAMRPGFVKESARIGFNQSKAVLEWTAATKQTGAVNSAQMNRFTQTATSFLNTAEHVRALADQLKQSGVDIANLTKRELALKVRGNSDLAQVAQAYVTELGALKTEGANVESGGYAPIQDAWKVVDQQIGMDMSWRRIETALDSMERVINYRLQAIPNFSTLGPAGANRYTGNPGRDLTPKGIPANPATAHRTPTYSPEQKAEAQKWLAAHPNDPRAKQIKEILDEAQ